MKRLILLAGAGFASLGGPAAARALPVTIAVVSGTPQSATAFIAQHGPHYEATFNEALVVRVSPKNVTVRFRCVTADCTFPPSVQPDEVSRVDTRTYDAKSVKGQASIKLTVSTATVETVTVEARPTTPNGAPAVRFVLIER